MHNARASRALFSQQKNIANLAILFLFFDFYESILNICLFIQSMLTVIRYYILVTHLYMFVFVQLHQQQK